MQLLSHEMGDLGGDYFIPMDITDEEKQLFRTSLNKTQPIKSQNKVVHRKKPSPVRKSVEFEEENNFTIDTSIYVANVLADEQLYFHRGGLQKKALRELRQGQLPIEAEIDLHGYTLDQAEQQLRSFLNMAQQRRLRVVHIIHGKGNRSQTEFPLLKNRVNQCLQQAPAVLAYCSAARHQGGAGAVNVVLRTKMVE